MTTTARTAELATALLDRLDDPAVEAEVLPGPNFWDVIHYGESSYENRYNRMVRWLLDPGGNHGLGSAVVRALAAQVGGFSAGAERVNRTVGSRRVRTRVETPVPDDGAGRSGRIDVTVEDREQSLYLAVESKLRSEQHSAQLARYRRHVESVSAPTADGWATAFVFLTEDEDAEPDDAAWQQVSYTRFAELVRELLEGRGAPHPSDKIVTDFLDDIARRARTAQDSWSSGLFYTDRTRRELRFGDLLLAVMADQAGGLEHLEMDGSTKQLIKRVPDLPDGAAVLAEVAAAFEERGRTGSDAIRTLTYVWDHRPPAQDKSRDGAVQGFYAELADLLGDRFLRTGGTAGQGGNLRWGDQRIWIAGNGKGDVVAMITHTERPLEKSCQLRTKVVFPVAADLAGVGAMTAASSAWTPAILRDALQKALSGGGVCSCGVALVG